LFYTAPFLQVGVVSYEKQLLKQMSYHPVLLILHFSCYQLSQVTFYNLALTKFWSRWSKLSIE